MLRVLGVLILIVGICASTFVLSTDPHAYPALAVCAVFDVVGAWVVWKSVLGPIRIGKPRAMPPSLGRSTDNPTGLLTPSEIVAVHGAYFVPPSLGRNVSLFDPATKMSARELVHAQLKAAILAHERAGTIRLLTPDTSPRVLRVEPTGVSAHWPESSVESRLLLQVSGELTAVIRQWAAEPSNSPWERAAEKVCVGMALRRVATVTQNGEKRVYSLANDETKAEAMNDLSAVADLLRRCETERPEIDRLLGHAIDRGISPPGVPTGFVQRDPWYDESAEDVRKISGLRLLDFTTSPLNAVIFVAAGLGFLGCVAALIVKSLNGTLHPKFEGSITQIVLGLATAAIAGGMSMLRRKVGRAITATVVGEPQPKAAAACAAFDGGSTAAPAPAKPLRFDIEILHAPELPPASDEARSRLKAIHERGSKVRQLYRSNTIVLISAAVLFGIVMEVVNQSYWYHQILAAVATVTTSFVVLWTRQILAMLRPVRGGRAEERTRWEKSVAPIRPVLTPLAGMIWSICLLLGAYEFLKRGTLPWSAAGAASCVAISLIYFATLYRGARKLQREYPVYPGLNLLVLRVFDSPSRDFFVQQLDLWHWIGPLSRLDGPDTAGSTSTAVLAWMTGRIDKAITENDEELAADLGRFVRRRDAQLRYPFNSLQCNDATWKKALDRLLHDADVIVMDLSGLKMQHRGCAYEIGRLVNEFPVDRFALLIDGNTDLEFLRLLLGEVSGSGGKEGDSLRLIHMGAPTERRPGESVYDWQRRSSTPIDPDRLVGLLLDSALRKHGPQKPAVVPWTRPGYWRAPAVPD